MLSVHGTFFTAVCNGFPCLSDTISSARLPKHPHVKGTSLGESKESPGQGACKLGDRAYSLQSAEKHANQPCPWFEALHLDRGRTTANVGSSLRLFFSLQAARSFLRLQVRFGSSSPWYGQAPSLDKWRPESLSMWAECSGSTLVFDHIEESGVWPEALLTGHVGLI